MILCVTLNPCLDKTLEVPSWRPGDLARGVATREVVGGKGNNVARALRRLGRGPRPVMFLGGYVGAHCESLLRSDDELDPLVVPTEAPTRVILTVRTTGTAEQTAFFDPDPAVTELEAAALRNRVAEALARGGVSALTLSGSSPSRAAHGLYGDLIALARARGVPVFLDTYGPALDAIEGLCPTAIQLNRREAAAHLRKPNINDADLVELLSAWGLRGAASAIVTDGPGPVLAIQDGRPYRVQPPPIAVVNPIGSGDSMLAGLVDGWLDGLGPAQRLRRAVACATANALVWDAGAIDPNTVRELESEIEVEAGPWIGAASD